MYLDIDGFHVCCSIEGSGDALLFLHGWGVGHEAYTPFLRVLQKTHRVYAPDLPGFGGTPEPAAPWGVDEYVGFLRAFVAHCGLESPLIAGHSNGGRVALHYLAAGGAAEKLALFGAAGVRGRRGAKYYAKVYAYKAAKFLLTPFPALKRRYQEKKGSTDYRSASPVMRGTMSRLLGSDVAPLLEKIIVPTLLVWGEDDTASPLADGKRMASAIPDAGLVVLPGGHWSFMGQLDRIERILNSFWGGGGA